MKSVPVPCSKPNTQLVVTRQVDLELARRFFFVAARAELTVCNCSQNEQMPRCNILSAKNHTVHNLVA